MAIGLYVNRYIGGMSDYVVAGRSLRSSLAIATMIGTELGLVTVMYSAQMGLTGGFAAMHIGIIAAVSSVIIGLTGFIVVPLRQMGVITIPEFYGRRFGPGVRVVGAIMLAGSGILNMGMFLKAGALFVTALTGLSDPTAVNWVMTALIVIVLIYTICGGMVSVVITDYLQFVLLSVGMLVACYLAWSNLGWSKLEQTVNAVHGDAGMDPFDTSGFGLSYVMWMIYTVGICSNAVWQTTVMRACAADSVETVRRLYVWSSIGFLIRSMVPQFLGICALTYFWNHDVMRETFFTADGELVKDAEVQLRAMPMYLSQILPVGVIGIIGAAMLAAFMSTHDSYLLCWSSVIAYDIAVPLSGGRISDKACLWIARAVMVLIGAFLLVWGLWYPLGQNLWDYMAVTGAIYFSGAFAVLLGGIYWSRASKTGAMLALICGFGALLGLTPIQQAIGMAEVRSDIIGLCVAGLSLVLMVGGSLLFPDKEPFDVQAARREKLET